MAPVIGLSLKEALVRVEGGIDAILRQAETLEEVVAAHFHSVGALQDDVIREMQALDALRQSLGDMSQLVQGLAQVSPAHQIDVDQLKGISTRLRLASTKALLNVENSSVSAQVSSSDLHLF